MKNFCIFIIVVALLFISFVALVGQSLSGQPQLAKIVREERYEFRKYVDIVLDGHGNSYHSFNGEAVYVGPHSHHDRRRHTKDCTPQVRVQVDINADFTLPFGFEAGVSLEPELREFPFNRNFSNNEYFDLPYDDEIIIEDGIIYYYGSRSDSYHVLDGRDIIHIKE